MTNGKTTEIAGNNIQVKLKNLIFYLPIVAQIFVTSMISTGTTFSEIQTWEKAFEVLFAYFTNPYLLGVLVIQIYGQLKNFDNKGGWKDDTFTRNKDNPTSPSIDLMIRGEEKTINDDSEVIIDNTDESIYGKELYNNGKKQ